MTRFRDWVQQQIAEFVRPELDASAARLQESVNDSIVALHQLAAREHEQTRSALAATLDRMQTRLEHAAGLEQAELRSLLQELVSATRAQVPEAATVVGGWIASGPTAQDVMPAAIDLTERIPVGTRVDARSRFNETWFEGLEVTEVVPENSGVRYRLTRVGDDRPLPMLFDAADLRPATADTVVGPSQ